MKETFVSMDERLKEEHSLVQKKISTISTLRVISFLAGAALFIIGVADALAWAGILGGIFLLVFIYLVKKHSDAYYADEIIKSKLQSVEGYIKRFTDEWRKFPDTGSEFVEKEDTVSLDLDLLGDNSLYQMISVAHTKKGKNKLATLMKLESTVIEHLGRRNDAVGELASKKDFLVDFESAGIRLESNKKKFKEEEFINYCKDESKGCLPAWAKIVRFVFPAIMIIAILLWAIDVITYGVPLVMFLVILSFSWLTKTVTDRVMMPLYGIGYGVEDYLSMLRVMENEEFTSEHLIEIKEKNCDDNGALVAFSKLKKIAQAYNISFNPLFHQILSGLFLWDYHLAYLMEKWKKRYGKNVSECFDDIGTLEELMSLAVVGVVRDTNWARIDASECEVVRVSFEDLYHPLINQEKVISNSAALDGGITIITGSNMSGKTTFLRTIAINLALAYMGAPICGKSLCANYMKIFTSMRVMDDVANGISTFYAEILRIKAMAEYKEKNLPMLCLIDEIFKGTNSADRIVGATEAIKQLSGDKCMTVVSTHDFELCSIKDDNGKPAVNYHFEEYYKDDELMFDYKLKDGRCTTTNAIKLLKMAGFSV